MSDLHLQTGLLCPAQHGPASSSERPGWGGGVMLSDFSGLMRHGDGAGLVVWGLGPHGSHTPTGPEHEGALELPCHL